MYNLNSDMCVIVIVFKCTYVYAQGYTLVHIKEYVLKS